MKTKWFFLGILFLACAFIVRIQPPAVLDTFFHLSVGRQVWETKQVPTRDDFVYADVNKNYTSNVWLSGLIFYAFVKTFGISGMLVLKAILIGAIVYFLIRTLEIFTKDEFKIGAFVLLAVYILAFRFNSRPEMISFAFLAIVNFCCFDWFFSPQGTSSPKPARGRTLWIYILPLIFLLWPNVHGFAAIGLAVFGFFVVIEMVRLLFSRNVLSDVNSRTYLFFIIFALSVLVSAVQYQRVISFLNAPKFSGFVLEWATFLQKLHPTGDYSLLGKPTFDNYVFLGYLVGFVVLFLFLVRSVLSDASSRTHLTFEKRARTYLNAVVFAFYGVFLILPFKYFRLIQATFLLSVPAFVYFCQKLDEKFGLQIVWKFLFAALGIFVVVCTLTGHLFGAEYENMRLTYPYGSEKFILENLNSRRIFTVGLWDDYYLWTVPGVLTYSDILMDTKTDESINIGKVMHNPDDVALPLLTKYDVDTVVNTSQWLYLLNNTPIWKLKNWKLVYMTGTYQIYAREDIIKAAPLNLSKIHPELETPLKFKIEDRDAAVDQLNKLLAYDSSNDFARGQLIIYYLTEGKDNEKAKNIAEESYKLFPKNPWFSFYLAVVWDSFGDCTKAVNFAQGALDISHNDNAISTSLAGSLAKCKTSN